MTPLKKTFPQRLQQWALAAPLTVLALAVAPAVAMAQAELKYASSGPPGSPFAKQIERLAADVAEETKGAVKISPFFNSQLGAEADVLGQVARGRVEMGGFTAASLALQIPEIGLLQLPFYFESNAQRDCVIDKHAHPLVVESLARRGLHFIGWGEVGAVQLPGKKAYATPADIRGAKVGVAANKVNIEFWRRIGANPVPTSAMDASASLQTGLIDAFPAVAAFYVPSGLNKVAPVLTRLDMFSAISMTVMSKSAYDKLPEAARTGLDRAAAKRSASLLRGEIRGMNNALYKMHTDAGGTLAQPTDDQVAQWRKDLAPYWTSMSKEFGATGEKLFAAMEAGKQSCSK